MALRQPNPALVAQQLAVIVLRRIQTQRPIQKKLPRRRLQQIRPTHDLRDPHRRIVDDDRQLIGRHIVAAPHNEVPKIPPRNHPLLLQPQIRKANLLPLRHPKPPIHSARFNPCSDARLGGPAQAKPSRPGHNIRRPARPRIHRLIIQTIRRPRRLGHIPPRAGARINHPRIPQPLPPLQIVLPPLALGIRTNGPAAVRSLHPRNAQPAQILEYRLHELRTTPLRIQILIAKNQLPMPFGSAPRRNPKRPRMSQMQQPSRRRRQPPAIRLRGASG